MEFFHYINLASFCTICWSHVKVVPPLPYYFRSPITLTLHIFHKSETFSTLLTLFVYNVNKALNVSDLWNTWKGLCYGRRKVKSLYFKDNELWVFKCHYVLEVKEVSAMMHSIAFPCFKEIFWIVIWKIMTYLSTCRSAGLCPSRSTFLVVCDGCSVTFCHPNIFSVWNFSMWSC